MKALTIPSLLLTLLLSLSLWSGAYVQQQITGCTQTLIQAEELARQENWDAAHALLQHSYESWQKGQDYFHAITEHQELDEAETLFAAAFAVCAQQDQPDFHAILAQLLTALEHISEKQQITLGNIL